jgi:hypothetical protein
MKSKVKLGVFLVFVVLSSTCCSSATAPTLVNDLGPLRISPIFVADAHVGSVIVFTASGGTGVYLWHLLGGEGTAPAWNEKTLSFRPTAPGRFVLELSCMPLTQTPIQRSVTVLP